MAVRDATERLKRALTAASAIELARMRELLHSISPEWNLSSDLLDRQVPLRQAVVWEAAWRVAPWTTAIRYGDSVAYTSPYLDPDVVPRPVLHEGDFEAPLEAKRLVDRAIEIEDDRGWNTSERVATVLGRIEREEHSAQEQRFEALERDFEYLSRVILLGNPRLTRMIVEHVASSTRRPRKEDPRNPYTRADRIQFVLFAMTRAPEARGMREIAGSVFSHADMLAVDFHGARLT